MISIKHVNAIAVKFWRVGVSNWMAAFLATGMLFSCLGCGQKADPPPTPKADAAPVETVEVHRVAGLKNDAAPVEIAALAAPAETKPSQNAALPAPDSKIPVYELKMEVSDLRQLERSAFGNTSFPATFIAGGVTYEHVQVRFRGQWSRSWPKKSFKIYFNSNQLFEEHGVLNLNSGWRDPAMIREPLGYYIYAACGVPASHSRMVRLQLNGQFRGLFVEVEPVDKVLLSRNNLKGAEVYKAVSHQNDADERYLGDAMAYIGQYEREGKQGKSKPPEAPLTPEQQADGLRNLQAFCKELSVAKDKADFFQKNLDVDKYINYLAATVLIQNWDSYNKNHYLVYDAQQSHKWLVIPWDLDRTFGDHWNQSFGEAQFPLLQGTHTLPGITGWNRLEDKFLSVPAFRTRFLNRLSELLAKEFTTEKLFPILDRYQAALATDATLEYRRWPRYNGSFQEGIAGVKAYIEERRDFLLGEIKRMR